MSTTTGPPAPERRVPITFLARPSSRSWLDSVAHHHHLTRADVLRVCMAVARKHERELVASLKALKEQS